MKNLEYTGSVAFLGSQGTNSHMAGIKFFPKASYLPYPSFEEIFEAVEKKEVEVGLIPIENSHAGRVAEIHNLLSKTKLYIVGEYFLDIEHHLAAVKGASIEDIKEVYSHPQALMQCADNIKKYKLKKHATMSTVMAAENVASLGSKKAAALCSDLAAKLNNLRIIQKNFQDDSSNKTIFIALARKMDLLEHDRNSKKITAILFTVRNIPAAIYKALGGFATNNINIVKLESYIPGGLSKEAQFFISFEGSPDDQNVQYALDELGFFTKHIKLLGVYDQAKERIKAKTRD